MYPVIDIQTTLLLDKDKFLKISLLFQEEIINSRVKNILEHQFCNDSKTIRNYTITVEKKANTDTHEAIKPSKFYARAVRFCSVK